MDQASSNIAAAAASDKAPRASKGKPAAKQAPARQVATQAQRIVITFNTAARECPDATQVGEHHPRIWLDRGGLPRHP